MTQPKPRRSELRAQLADAQAAAIANRGVAAGLSVRLASARSDNAMLVGVVLGLVAVVLKLRHELDEAKAVANG